MTVKKDAIVSQDEKYRYCLWREWDIGGAVTFVMLNPSTADARIDDPTIRRCIGFAKKWGFGRMVVVNVFAFRATNPKKLPNDILEAIGTHNMAWLDHGATYGELIVPAWGVEKPHLWQGYDSAKMTLTHVAKKHGTPIKCLATNQDGSPKHPLYVPANARRKKYKFNQ